METIANSDSEDPLNQESEGYEDEQIEQQHDGSAQNVASEYFPEDSVIVADERETWPGHIDVIEEGAYVKFMNRSGLWWKWSEIKDKIFHLLDDTKHKIT